MKFDSVPKAMSSHFDPGNHLFLTSDLDDLVNVGMESGSGSTLDPYGMKTVTLLQGEPFVIPCSISTISTPFHIHWYQNGKMINDNVMVSNIILLKLSGQQSYSRAAFLVNNVPFKWLSICRSQW